MLCRASVLKTLKLVRLYFWFIFNGKMHCRIFTLFVTTHPVRAATNKQCYILS